MFVSIPLACLALMVVCTARWCSEADIPEWDDACGVGRRVTNVTGKMSVPYSLCNWIQDSVFTWISRTINSVQLRFSPFDGLPHLNRAKSTRLNCSKTWLERKFPKHVHSTVRRLSIVDWDMNITKASTCCSLIIFIIVDYRNSIHFWRRKKRNQ